MKLTRNQRKAETAAKRAALALIALSDLPPDVCDTAYMRTIQKLQLSGYKISADAIVTLRLALRNQRQA